MRQADMRRARSARARHRCVTMTLFVSCVIWLMWMSSASRNDSRLSGGSSWNEFWILLRIVCAANEHDSMSRRCCRISSAIFHE